MTFESCPGAGNLTRAGILWKLKVKHVVRLLVLLVIKGVRKIAKNWGNTTLLISSSNYAKRHINVCLRGHLCSLFFSNFSEIPCVKIGFYVNDFLRMMNESRFPECERFHFLLSSWTLLLLAGTAFSSYKKQSFCQ